MNVLVACDSFKGSLSAATACRLIAEGIATVRPKWQVARQPLADGGEGTGGILVESLGGEWVACPEAEGPLPGRTVAARWGWMPDRRLAVVEAAEACGLTLLRPDERNPLRTSTRGVGQLLVAAARRQPSEILLTLGGSGTVDGGTGAASALGWQFLNARGEAVNLGGGGLGDIHRIRPPPAAFPVPVTVLCDVRNPLLGDLGAARVFGPQKGATPEMVEQLEAGLTHLAHLLRRDAGLDVATLPGAGAAGGFGAGAAAFLRAALVPGFARVAGAVGLVDRMRGCDWVITGEGCFDEQSLRGKVVSGVCDLARQAGVRVAVLAGRVRLAETAWRAAGVAYADSAARADADETVACRHAAPWLREAASRWAHTSGRSGGEDPAV